MADSSNAALLAKLKAAFERDPLTTYFAILVAANRVLPTEVIAIGNRKVMVPAWGAEGWRWFGQLAHVIQDAAYAGNTPVHAVKLSADLDALLLSDAMAGEGEGIDTAHKGTPDDPMVVYPNRPAGPPAKVKADVMKTSGSIVADAAKWMAKNKAITTAAVGAALAFIVGGPPAWIAAILAWLVVNPDQLGKIFQVAGELVSEVIGGAAKGLLKSPLVLIAIAFGAYYMLRGKGE